MKNTRISVELSTTINLGNYESKRLQAGISFDIPDGENVEEHYRNAWTFVENELDKRGV